jgi:hypothetical protein
LLPPQRGRGQLGGEGIDSEDNDPYLALYYAFRVASKVASKSLFFSHFSKLIKLKTPFSGLDYN